MDAHVLCNFSSADCPILVQTVALPNVIALCCHFHINECKTAPLMSVRAHYIYWCALVSSDGPSASFKQTQSLPIKKYPLQPRQWKHSFFDHLKSRRRSCQSLRRCQSLRFHCLLFARHHTSSSFIRRRREFTKSGKKRTVSHGHRCVLTIPLSPNNNRYDYYRINADPVTSSLSGPVGQIQHGRRNTLIPCYETHVICLSYCH